MPDRPLPRVFSLFATERNRAVDDALMEALPHVEGGVRSASLDMLCKRARPESLAAVVVRCPQYEPSLRVAIHQRLGEFHAGVRQAIESTVLEERAAAIEAIASAGDDKSAYLLADALRTQCPRTRELAAGTIRRLTEALIARRRAGINPNDAPDYHEHAARITDVLQSVVQYWEVHLHREALAAALWMIESVEAVMLEKLKQPQSRILRALNEILQTASDPRLAGAVLRALAIPELRAAAVQAVTRARDSEFVGALVEESWLLGDGEVERGCRWVRDASPIRDRITETVGWNARLATRAVRWIDSTGGPREKTLAILREFVRADSEELRRAVLWRLVEDESAGATELLAMIAARSHDAMGEIAARECHRRRASSGPTATPRSPAAMAESRTPAARAFEKYFEEFDRLTPGERQSLARDLSAAVPDLAHRVAAKMDAPNPLARAAALRMLPVFGLVPEMADRIHRCANDRDALVRCAALSLLDGLAGPTSQRLLRAALNDPDVRVQATAIETLDRLDARDHREPIGRKLNASDNRVRANAIKALMHVELGKAGAALLDMLEDQSGAHRVSALWVVERLRLQSVAERIVVMSRDDHDPRVRARARRVLRKLSPNSAFARQGQGPPTEGTGA